jgi:hypothetical protein
MDSKYLRDRLVYAPETGVFTWKPIAELTNWDAYWNRQFAHRTAGSIHKSGYLRINIDCRTYLGHLLAWQYVNGEKPKMPIDHINRDRADNRIANLRIATAKQNARNKRVQRNNTSGVLGITWNKSCQKWQASLEADGKCHYLGVFKELNDAAAARRKASIEVFGEWAGEN